MKELIITTEYITIGQFLKIKNYISSGGEAKYFLDENSVYVNGEITKQRGKKIRKNDVVKILNKEYLIL